MARLTGLAFVAGLFLLTGQALAMRDLPGSHTQQDNTRCTSCLLAFRMLDDMLADPEVVTSLVNYAEASVCPTVHGGDKCRNLAEGLLPVAIQWLQAPATAWSFCHAAGACGPGSQNMAQQAVATVELPKVVRDDSAPCAMCKVTVFQLQQVLNDTQIVTKIIETAQQACAQLPPDLAASCTDFVNKYEVMLQHFISEASPQEVCEMVGVCAATPATSQPVNARRTALLAARMMELQAAHARGQSARSDYGLGTTCDMCKMAVLEAHSLVANPQVQSSLINYTKALCESFPSFKDTCELYVDTYAPVVFSLLEQALASPDNVCAEIGVCTPPTASVLEQGLRASVLGHAQANVAVARALRRQTAFRRRAVA